MSAATVSLPDMGEWNITSQIKIDGQIAPDFSFDWEVLFQGHKYIQPLRKPQGAKENTILNSVINLTFQHWAIYQLKRFPFVTMQPIDSGTAVADEEVATVSLNLGDFIILFAQVLAYYYGDKITIQLNPEWQYKAEAEVITISHTKVWNVLIEVFYKQFGVRWQIEPNGSPDKYVIKVGYPTTEQSHIFEYGFQGGLMKVERQVQSEEICNILKGRGGEKNLPYRYFKNVDPENPSFKADPDWIEELANIYFANLMPATFRSYVQGWKAAHISKYPGYKAVGEANAYAPWAYRKGFTDTKFHPVEFVADEITINPETGDKQVEILPGYSPFVKKGSSLDKYGPLLNSLDNNEEIYPTIQGVTVDPYGRIDEVIEVEPITSDDIEEAAENDAKISTLRPSIPVTEKVGPNSRKIINLTGASFTVPEGKHANFEEGSKVVKLTKDTMAYFWDIKLGHFVTRNEKTEVLTGIVVEETNVVVEDSNSNEVSASGIPPGIYRYKVSCEVHNTTSDTLNVTLSLESSTLTEATLGEKWTDKWNIWVKNIWQTSKESTETPEQYARRVWEPILGDRIGNEAKIVFASGLLAHEDYEFVITSIPKYERKKCTWQTVEGGKVVEHEYWSEWCIELGKSDAELETLGVYLPSTKQQGKAGDFFFFIGIDMPHQYTVWGEERVDDWKKDNLAEKKDIKPTWVVQTDRVRLNGEGKPDALIRKLHPGDTLRLADKRFIEGDYETLYLSSLTYKYREPSSNDAALNPDVEIVLSDRYEVSANPVATLQGEVSALVKQVGSISNVEQIVRAVADKIYLRKDGLPDRSMSPTEFASLLTSFGFRSGMVGGAGWGIYKDANGNWVIEADRFMARQDFEVNNLIVNQVIGQGGTIVESAALLEIARVDETENGYKCYFDQHEGTLANLFHVDDVAWCNRFTPENNSLKFYKRRVVEVGVDFVLLSDVYVNGVGIPTEGDAIVQYGNYTDKNRQFVKVRDVIGGGYERYIEGLDSVNAVGTEYFFVGRQTGLYNGRPRWFIGDDNGFIEWINGVLKIKGSLDILSTFDGKTLGNYIDDAAQSAADTAKAELQGKINELQNQVDGVIESFNGQGAPTLNNYPANEWTTDAERQRHDRDIYTDITPYVDDATTPTSGQSWKWYYNSPTDYGWNKIADSEAVRALQLAQMSVTVTDVLYKQGNSLIDYPSPLPATDSITGEIINLNGWSTDAPEWEDNKYIWQTTYVRKGNGNATFSDPTCISGKNGRTPKITEQYYLSTSSTQLSGGSWQDKKPTWIAGRYYWTRSKIDYGDSVEYTEAICVTPENGTSVLAEYSADATNWHSSFQSGDVWMRTGTDGVSWSPAIRVVGVNGSNYSNNLILNSDFSDGYAHWNFKTGVTIDDTHTIDGRSSALINSFGNSANSYWGITQDGTAQVNPSLLLKGGDVVTASIWAYSDDISTIDAGVRLEIKCFDAQGNTLTQRVTDVTLTKSNEWQRFFYTRTLPEGTVNVQIFIYVVKNGRIWVSSPKCELGENIDPQWTPAPSEMIGTDGSYPKYQWALSTSSTSASNILESDWSDSPLIASAGWYVWMRMGMVTPPDTEPQSYNQPIRLTGDKGEKGDSVYMLDLSNEVAGIACDSNGIPNEGVLPTSKVTVYEGNSKAVGWETSIAKNGLQGCSAVLSDNTITVLGIEDDTASITVQATKSGYPTLTATMNLYKVRPGAVGTPAETFSIFSDVDNITKSFSGELSVDRIGVLKYRQIGNNAPVRTPLHNLYYQRIGEDDEEILILGYGWQATRYITITNKTESVILTLKSQDNGTVLDTERIPVLTDASDIEIGTRNIIPGSNRLRIDGAKQIYSAVRVNTTVSFWQDEVYSLNIGGIYIYGQPVLSGRFMVKIFNNAVTKEVGSLTNIDPLNPRGIIKITADSGSKPWLYLYAGDEESKKLLNGVTTDGVTLDFENVQLVKGNVPLSDWTAAPEDTANAIGKFDYLAEAMKEDAKFTGGLLLASTVSLGKNNTDYTSQVTWSGINGIYKEGAVGGGISAWYGGDMYDLAEYYDWDDVEMRWIPKSNVSIPDRIARGVDRMDGSGYRAGGNFWWDNEGYPYFIGGGIFTGQVIAGDKQGQRIELNPNQKSIDIYGETGSRVATHSGRIIPLSEAVPPETSGPGSSKAISFNETFASSSSESYHYIHTFSIALAVNTTGAGVLKISVPAISLTAKTLPGQGNISDTDAKVRGTLYLKFYNGTELVNTVGLGGITATGTEQATAFIPAKTVNENRTVTRVVVELECYATNSKGLQGQATASAGTNMTSSFVAQWYRCEYGANGWVISYDSNNYAYMLIENGKLNFKVVSNGNTVISSD